MSLTWPPDFGPSDQFSGAGQNVYSTRARIRPSAQQKAQAGNKLQPGLSFEWRG